MPKLPKSLFCVCSKNWKSCINKKWSKRVEKDPQYSLPYTLGMAELGYEYDFINNRRVQCLKKKE